MTDRTVIAQHPAGRDDIGDLVTRRPLPGAGLPLLDPFLFLNHHGPQVYPPNNRGLPFGPHPHRGFETVTFILEGSLAHHDSGGHESVIEQGGVQWMTTGSGLVHAEVSPASFRRSGGPLEILQLWVNLPARLKMTQPRYTGVQRGEIPAVPLPGGGTLALIAGAFGGETGAIRTPTDVFMSVVRLPAGSSATLPAPAGRTALLYAVRGGLRVADTAVREWNLAQLDDAGEQVTVEALDDAVLLWGHAAPLDEPVVAHGPFVMNTREDIAVAVQDYQAGRFGPAPLL